MVTKELAKWKEKSEAKKRQRVVKKIRVQKGDATDNVSRITPSISSSSALLISTQSARKGEFNVIEEHKAKIKER